MHSAVTANAVPTTRILLLAFRLMVLRRETLRLSTSAKPTAALLMKNSKSWINLFARTPLTASVRCVKLRKNWWSKLPLTRRMKARVTSPALHCAFHAFTVYAGTSQSTKCRLWKTSEQHFYPNLTPRSRNQKNSVHAMDESTFEQQIAGRG